MQFSTGMRKIYGNLKIQNELNILQKEIHMIYSNRKP
jgi:hypothetical protein